MCGFHTGKCGRAVRRNSGTAPDRCPALRKMTDTMEADLAEITATENKAIKDYDGLMAAKTKEAGAGAAILYKIEKTTMGKGPTWA